MSTTLHCAVLFVLVGGRQYATSDASLARRFLQEAPQQWKQHEATVSWLKATRTATMLRDDGSSVHSRIRLRLGDSETQGISDWWIDGPDGSYGGVHGANSRYSFLLSRRSQSGELSIRDVLEATANAAELPRAMQTVRRATSHIRRLGRIDLLEIVSSPDFAVASAREVLRDRGVLVEIEFTYNPENPEFAERAAGIFRSGTILFCPDRFWSVVEAEVEVVCHRDLVRTKRIRTELAPDMDVPVVAEQHVALFSQTNRLEFEETVEYHWSRFAGGEHDFTLSAYGFPEPVFHRAAPRTRLWVAIGSLGVLLICLAFALRGRRGEDS